MNRYLVIVGTWFWKYLPVRRIRHGVWSSFLWWMRGKRKIETIDGITYDLDLSEMIDICIYVGRFEKEVAEFIETTCKNGFVVLDIGANIGAHCLRFARLVEKEGVIYAFEPTDYAYAKLQKNIRLNNFGNIQSHRVALANQNLPQQNISYRSSWKTDGSLSESSSIVDFVRLDDWADKNSIERLDIIKIDVDGNEFSVLDGSRDLIDKFKPMVIAEVGAWHFEDPERNPWSILEERGYRFWDLQSSQEYSSLMEMRAVLPQEDKEMGFSINIVAKTGDSPWGLER